MKRLFTLLIALVLLFTTAPALSASSTTTTVLPVCYLGEMRTMRKLDVPSNSIITVKAERVSDVPNANVNSYKIYVDIEDDRNEDNMFAEWNFDLVKPCTASVTLKAGTYYLKVGTYSNEKFKCKLTVTMMPASAQKISFPKTKETVKYGDTLQLKPNITPRTEVKVKWKSSKNKVATVSSKGIVTAKGVGTATITATLPNGKKATCKVTVPKLTISFKKASQKLNIGHTLQLDPVINSAVAVSVKWSSSNKNVATVSKSGIVTAKAAGKTKITAKLSNGKTATCTITVNKN